MTFIVENIDLIIKIVGMLLVVMMALPKAQELRAKALAFVDDNHFNAAKTLAVGICSQVYHDTVRELKAAGTFTPEMKSKVFNRAKDAILGQIQAHGLDVARETVPYLIEWGVNQLKGEAKAALPLSLPLALPETLPSMPPPVEPDLTEAD